MKRNGSIWGKRWWVSSYWSSLKECCFGFGWFIRNGLTIIHFDLGVYHAEIQIGAIDVFEEMS